MEKQSFQIISDGSCDLPPAVTQARGIRVVPFYVSFDGENYKKEIEEVAVRDFYQEMVDHKRVYPKSSMPSAADFREAFEPFVKEEIPIICICITSKFSGSQNSAMSAANALKEKYGPQTAITVIDSTVNTILQGLYVLEAVRMREHGLSYEKAVKQLLRIRSTGRILFTIGSMDYLQKGGRIGKVVGILGGTLRIMPLIELREGEIFPTGMVRNRKKGLKRLIEQAREHFAGEGEDPDGYSLVIGYGYDYQEAVSFRDELLESMREYSGVTDIPLYQIGAAIGVHTGPYPLGIGLIKRYDAK